MGEKNKLPDSVTHPSFINQYLDYIGETEAPIFYHRWSILSAVGAMLGRQFYSNVIPGTAYPNLYTMIIGAPGTRKSTAIKAAVKVIRSAGYDTLSADKCSKEKFLMDLAGMESEGEIGPKGKDINSLLDENLFGELDSEDPREMFIACDEFNDFIGSGNMEFISLLGNLWDYSGTYSYRTKGGKPVNIKEPTVSILGGNTTVALVQAFPPEAIGQGFMSRLLLIHGEPTGIKIPFPTRPSVETTENIIKAIQHIKENIRGEAILSSETKTLLAEIYKDYKPMEDARFISYSSRRFTHLIKLCLVIAACHYSVEVLPEHVIEANTLLTRTEFLMPKSLGQFGKAKGSEVTHAVVTALEHADKPLTVGELFSAVSQDVSDMGSLFTILNNLMLADKITHHNHMYALKIRRQKEENSRYVNFNYLSKQERES